MKPTDCSAQSNVTLRLRAPHANTRVSKGLRVHCQVKMNNTNQRAEENSFQMDEIQQ